MLLDINPPQLGTVTIEGKLSFEDLKDLTLDATSVVVWGTLAIGSAHQPHTHEAVIRLLLGAGAADTLAETLRYI